MTDSGTTAMQRRIAKSEAERKTPEELQRLEDLRRKKAREDDGDTEVAQAVPMA